MHFSGFTTVQPKKKAKVSSDGSKARGGNCDTRLDIMAKKQKYLIQATEDNTN